MFAFPRSVPRPTILAITALVGAIFALAPGAAQAADPACGDTITTDTTLHADLVNCPGDGLVIGANNITLNLNGHRSTGLGTLSGSTCRSFARV